MSGKKLVLIAVAGYANTSSLALAYSLAVSETEGCCLTGVTCRYDVKLRRTTYLSITNRDLFHNAIPVGRILKNENCVIIYSRC